MTHWYFYVKLHIFSELGFESPVVGVRMEMAWVEFIQVDEYFIQYVAVI